MWQSTSTGIRTIRQMISDVGADGCWPRMTVRGTMDDKHGRRSGLPEGRPLPFHEGYIGLRCRRAQCAPGTETFVPGLCSTFAALVLKSSWSVGRRRCGHRDAQARIGGGHEGRQSRPYPLPILGTHPNAVGSDGSVPHHDAVVDGAALDQVQRAGIQVCDGWQFNDAGG